MANIANPRTVNVTLRGKEEKARWAALAPLDSMPSRFPLIDPINDMGIQTSWDGLVEAGHLTYLFANVYGSYKVLTLEFLSTLRVHYEDKALESITFRLQNVERTLSLAEFNAVFRLLDDGEEGYTDDPAEYNRNDFWGQITLNEATSSRGPTFTPSRAKINSIRNPVLRYMAKALVCFPFAHKELGSISSEILFILWGMLAHRRINVGYFMIKHLERHAKRRGSGKLCCGGVVTALALHCGINLEERTPDMGSRGIDWDILKKSAMVMVDGRGAGYFILDKDKEIFFRFPSSQLTAVGGWTDHSNWKMNTQAHLDRMASDPPQGRGSQSQNPMRVGAHLIPRPVIIDEPMPTRDEQANENEDDEEDEEEAESSQPKRRRPVGRPSRDSQLSEILAGIRSVRLEQANQREDNQIWRAQQETRLDYFGERIDHLQAQGDARWAEEQAFYSAYYARFPPPSD